MHGRWLLAVVALGVLNFELFEQEHALFVDGYRKHLLCTKSPQL